MTSCDTLARVRAAGGPELVERLEHLDRVRTARITSPALGEHPGAVRPPERGDALDADVIIAGGGLWLLLAPLLVASGLSVIVVERARAGAVHREWNASRPELEALVRVGLLTHVELEAMIVAHYREGTCRFAGGGTYPVRGVLDHAVNAGLLLEHARRLGQTRGVVFADYSTVEAESASEHGVRVRIRDASGAERELAAAVLVDARGVCSPYSSADLVCPTVGGVLGGLAQGSAEDPSCIDPNVGEILATIDDVSAGRQHVWEAFPGRTGETTVYLFHYANAREVSPLMDLYARFFAELPRYKRGDARLLRPTFGFIPGWSRLVPAPKAPHSRIVLVGDAAARQSPLTYCGFGATLRSLGRAADTVQGLVAGRPAPACAVDDAKVHGLTGALASVMATRALRGAALNALLDAAFHTLWSMGNEPYARLLRDEMSPREVATFLRRTAVRHPSVWRTVLRIMPPASLGLWGLRAASALWSDHVS